ncbi:hypothetical protein AMK12_22330 [Streptomyces sp. TSRI0395]|nr:hypothetical protein AMK12_22330 [Streptomyces sp. TSRI0395]
MTARNSHSRRRADAKPDRFEEIRPLVAQHYLHPDVHRTMTEGRFRIAPKPALIYDCLQSGRQDLNLRPLDPQE